MTQELWSQVDAYLAERLVPSDPVLDAALAASKKADLPEIAVAPNQGKFLNLVATIAGARSILEIGTLGGYSTIWLARALPAGGRLITLEVDPKHAEVARGNIEAAGFGDVVEVRVGPAMETLPGVEGPFDLVFIDADKVSYPGYLAWAADHLREGGVVLADNAFGFGEIHRPGGDEGRAALRKFNHVLARGGRFRATMLPTAEGLAMGVKIR
jgi:predicted O-methyltransferase YrrM